jgi:DNA-binding NarL/FixJ family response regulator
MSALLREAGIEVTGVGESWNDAERLAPGCDVVVVDLWMPELEIETLGRIRLAAPRATLAVITALDLDDAAARVAPVPIDLLLSKSAPPAEVAEQIAAHARAAATAASG